LDRFYAWAAQLQVEIRDIKKRMAFLESQTDFSFKPSPDCAAPADPERDLLCRLQKLKGRS
jgi:hypothetical protein